MRPEKGPAGVEEDNDVIYHVFPGDLVLHVPSMMEAFHRHAEEFGVSREEQYFFLYRTDERSRCAYTATELPPGRFEMRSGKRLDSSLLGSLDGGDILILHSAFYDGLWQSLLVHPRLWKNIALVHWGAELSLYRRQKRLSTAGTAARGWSNGLKRSFRDPGLLKRFTGLPRKAIRILRRAVPDLVEPSLRNFIIPRLGAVCTLTPGEFEAINELHGPCDNYFPVFYNTCPAGLEPVPGRESGGTLTVLLGNSGWPSNEHLPLLSMLARFRDEDIRVICPLGYPSAHSDYIDVVAGTGREILGEKFVPLLELIPREDYSALLESVDVLIQNAKRQQGFYGIQFALLSGKKVYLNVESPTFSMVTGHGIEVFDAKSIGSSSFDGFRSFPATSGRRNFEIARRHFSLEASLAAWRDLIGSMKAGTSTPGDHRAP